MTTLITHPCPPCQKPVVRALRKSRAAQSLIDQYARNLKTDLDYLEQQKRILDWIEFAFPEDSDLWCGLTMDILAKRWKRSKSTVCRWRRQWEAEGLIVQKKRKGCRTLFFRAGPNIAKGLLG